MLRIIRHVTNAIGQLGLLIGLFAAICWPAQANSVAYRLGVESRLVGDGKVELDITTNIPGTIEVMADIELRDDQSSDQYVGTDAEKVILTHGAGKVTVDVSKLPRGKYEAEIEFYPR